MPDTPAARYVMRQRYAAIEAALPLIRRCCRGKMYAALAELEEFQIDLPEPQVIAQAFRDYYASWHGQRGEFARQPHTLIRDEFWDEPREAWARPIDNGKRSILDV